MNNDYSQLEIDNIIVELKTVHKAKLKDVELYFLQQLQKVDEITQPQRDVLLKLYDSIGEPGY